MVMRLQGIFPYMSTSPFMLISDVWVAIADFQLPMQTTASARQNADRGSLVDSIALHKTGIDEHIIHQAQAVMI